MDKNGDEPIRAIASTSRSWKKDARNKNGNGNEQLRICIPIHLTSLIITNGSFCVGARGMLAARTSHQTVSIRVHLHLISTGNCDVRAKHIEVSMAMATATPEYPYPSRRTIHRHIRTQISSVC